MRQAGTLPLLSDGSHDWSILLTMVEQVIYPKALAVEENHMSPVTFDMALYEKIIQLVDSRPYSNGKVMPRLCEFRVVVCALRDL